MDSHTRIQTTAMNSMVYLFGNVPRGTLCAILCGAGALARGSYALALSISGSGFSSAGDDVSNSNCSCPLSADTLPR
jgi:hypothetical protein